MDNFGSTVSPHIIPHTGNPLNPEPIPPLAAEPESTATVEALVSTPLEPVLSTTNETNSPTQTDGNVQAHVDVTYQAHDVALASTKTNSPQPKQGLKTIESKKIPFDVESNGHPEKAKSCCALLNKLSLAFALVCFALLLCSILYIILNQKGFNGRFDAREYSRLNSDYPVGYDDGLTGRPSNDLYFNLTEPKENGIIVVLSRRGASISDILLPYYDKNGTKLYRSIVLQGGNENHFGAVRFGFHDASNSLNMIGQLPSDYPFLNYHTDDWTMFVDTIKPYRVRFVHNLIQVIYEFSSTNVSELRMTTMIATPSNQKIIGDPTNNVYFNLRGHGDLSTHLLNITISKPINIENGQKVEQDRLFQAKQVDKLTNINNYFYAFDRAGLGKNYVATLSESETKTILHIFCDHTGLVIDPFGDGTSSPNIHYASTNRDVRGIRISPRQSPTYNTSRIYGTTFIEYPSQAIHSTWWQIQYEN